MTDAMIQAITIPLFFLGVAVAVLLFLYKSRVKKLEALVKIVELGGNVDPDMLKMLNTGNEYTYRSDIKLGMIWLAVGIPVTLGMYVEGGLGDAVYGMIPVLVGVAFLISARLRQKEDN